MKSLRFSVAAVVFLTLMSVSAQAQTQTRDGVIGVYGRMEVDGGKTNSVNYYVHDGQFNAYGPLPPPTRRRMDSSSTGRILRGTSTRCSCRAQGILPSTLTSESTRRSSSGTTECSNLHYFLLRGSHIYSPCLLSGQSQNFKSFRPTLQGKTP